MTRKVIMKNLITLDKINAIEGEDGAVMDKNGNPLDRFWVPFVPSPGFLSSLAVIAIGALMFIVFGWWGAKEFI